MNYIQNNISDDNQTINIRTLILDPLSVIIKLAILGNKPVGTKILIQNNNIYLQEPGLFQAVCRMFFHSNKTDLQYMYNPIQIACQTFLNKEFIQKTPRIKELFVCSQHGLKRLIETYKSCSIIHLCLNYYYAIITNHIEKMTLNQDQENSQKQLIKKHEVRLKELVLGSWSETKVYKSLNNIISELINKFKNG